jgi:hypothetical protein
MGKLKSALGKLTGRTELMDDEALAEAADLGRKASQAALNRTFQRQQAAEDAGSSFEFPQIEKALAAGATLEFFDRTNAVFYVEVGHQQADGKLDESLPHASVPRAMRLVSAFAEIEAQLAGKKGYDSPSMMTGAPSEHDAIEGYLLYYKSQTGRITLSDGTYSLQFSRYDSTEQQSVPVGDPLTGPTLSDVYSQAVELAERLRADKAAKYGQDAPIPYALPAFMGDNEALRLRALLQMARERAESDLWLVNEILRGVDGNDTPTDEETARLRRAVHAARVQANQSNAPPPGAKALTIQLLDEALATAAH